METLCITKVFTKLLIASVLQAHLSWCWQRAPAYPCPLSNPTATATRRQQDTVSRYLSQALATACKRPWPPPSLHMQAGATPSIHLPQSFTRPLSSHSALYRGSGDDADKPFFFVFCFFYPFLPFLKLSWRTQFYSLQFVVKEKDFITKFDFSHIPYWLG